MNRNGNTGWIVAMTALLALAASAAVAPAQQPATAGSEVPYTQQRLRKQFQALVRKMVEVADLLAEREPATARAIRAAVDQAQRAFIDENMAKVVEHFNKGLMALAQSTQADVVEELRKVLRTLQQGDLSADAEKVRQWREYLQRVEELTKRQEEHLQRSKLAAEGRELSERMKALAERLEKIVKRQEQLLKRTKALPPADQAVRKLARLREEVRKLIQAQGSLKADSLRASPGKLLLAAEAQKLLQQRATAVADKLRAAGGDPTLARAMILIVNTWLGYPYMMIIASGMLQAVPLGAWLLLWLPASSML